MPTERIAAIHMSAFRGIPNTFDLELGNGQSLLVLGANATGKSSIADAIEWHLSGRIELLQHEGRSSDIRHAGAAGNVPTFVRVATNGALDGETHADSGSAQEPFCRAPGETYLLRGRLLTEFVNLRKGDKWKRLASLLGLEDIDQLRLDIQTASNKLESDLSEAKSRLSRHREALQPLWEDDSEQGFWEAVKGACEAAKVEEPGSLDLALALPWAAAIQARDPSSQRTADAERIAIAVEDAPLLAIDLVAWNGAAELLREPSGSELSFLRSARSLLATRTDLEECPLCLQPVDRDALAESVTERLSALFEESRSYDGAMATSSAAILHVAEVLERRDSVAGQAREAGLTIPDPPSDELGALRRSLDLGELLSEADIEHVQAKLRAWDQSVVEFARTAAAGNADQLTPIVRLVQLVERGRAWRESAALVSSTELAAHRARALLSEATQRQARMVQEILDAISEPLAEIYSLLHPEESLDSAAVEQWGEKGLELAIEFHGERRRPPHGVLSESHMNSLAIAVFLAMAETFNETVGFLVLDDVVSSFDIAHRGQLAELLVDRFSDWQLIVLTHDQLFFERVRRLAPNWQVTEFTSWDFETGPRRASYLTTDHIARAHAAVANGESVPTIGGAVRRALEEALQEACERLGAPLRFRRGFQNDRREIQELIDGLRRVARDLDGTTRTVLLGMLQSLEADTQSALNPEVHAGQQWASMEEVLAALGRVEAFVAWWRCDSCPTARWWSWTGTTGSCRCGATRVPPGSTADDESDTSAGE